MAPKRPRWLATMRPLASQTLPSKICSWEPNSVGDLLLSSISRKSLTLIFHSAHAHYKSIGASEKLILKETLSEPFQFAVYIFAHNIDQHIRSLAGTQSKSLWAIVKSSNLSIYLIDWQINYEVWAHTEGPNEFENVLIASQKVIWNYFLQYNLWFL